jgi:signal peptidase II
LVFANLGPPTGGDDPGYWLLPGAFRLVCHFNTGGAFGWASGNILLFLGAAAVLVPVLVLTAYHCRDPRAPLWGLGLVVGGAIGNLYDRLLHPGVRDFLELVNPRTGSSLWPVFNLADVAIVVGVAAYLVWSFFDNRRGKRQAVNPDNRTDP